MPRGRRHTRMFSDWELAEMCLMRLKGLSWTRIGHFYGCSDKTVKHALKRRHAELNAEVTA